MKQRLEDFFLAKFAQGLAFQPDRGNDAFLGVCLRGFSLDAFSADPSRQKTPLDTRRETAGGNVAIILSPSTPDTVALVHGCVLTTSEQITMR